MVHESLILTNQFGTLGLWEHWLGLYDVGTLCLHIFDLKCLR